MRLSRTEQTLRELELYGLLSGYFSPEEQARARDTRRTLSRAALASETSTTFSMFLRMGRSGYLPMNRRAPLVLGAHLVEVTELSGEPPVIALRSDYKMRFVGKRMVSLAVSDWESSSERVMQPRRADWQPSSAAFRTGPALDHLLEVVPKLGESPFAGEIASDLADSR